MAGATVGCECGRTVVVPSLRELRGSNGQAVEARVLPEVLTTPLARAVRSADTNLAQSNVTRLPWIALRELLPGQSTPWVLMISLSHVTFSAR